MNNGGRHSIKKIHKLIVISFIIVTALFVGVKLYMYFTTNGKGPEITFDKKEITVKTSASDEKLLAGVKAVDAKGNDVTDSIIIEGYSKLLKGNKRQINYIAYDANNNIGKATRTIKYKNYISPRITANQSLEVYSEDEGVNILAALTCKDCLDGNISNNIQQEDYTAKYDQDGQKVKYQYNISVSNSAGDTSSLQIPYTVNIVDNPSMYPQVVLTDYIVYVKKGSSFSSSNYIKCVQQGNTLYKVEGRKKPKDTKTLRVSYNVEIPRSDISYKSDVNVNKKGLYEVRFKVKFNEQTGYSTMLVVVE